MARTPRLTRDHLLKGVLCLSVISCFAWPRGFERPRAVLAPILAPLSHGGAYVAATVKRNLTDLIGGVADEQALRDALAGNEPLRRQLSEHINDALLRRVVAQEQLLAKYQRQMVELSNARRAVGEGFPCMLLPASVIGASPTAFGHTRLLRPAGPAAAGEYVTTRELLTDRPTAIPEQVAVLSASSVIGRIVSGGAWTAHVQLVIDPDFHMRAYVVRVVYEDRERLIRIEEVDPDSGRTVLRERALTVYDPPIPVNLTGSGAAMTSAPAPAHHAIEPGDFIVTMGDDGWLPLQVTIGVVERVVDLADSPKHVALKIAPAADLSSLRSVIVVVPLARRGG